MSAFSDFARAFGFGRDRAGDAARRRQQGVVNLRDGTAAAGLPPAVMAAVHRDLSRRADRILEEAKRMGADPLPEHAPVPGHLLTYRKGRAGTEATCECGRWDGWFTGPRSRRVVLGDHAAHADAELSAAGPLKVHAERADQPRELE